MSYDLNFWRYEDESVSNNHQAVYEKLSDGEYVEGLLQIPVEDILVKLKIVFSAQGWTSIDEFIWESGNSYFQMYTTPQFFRVDCYKMNGTQMNQFIDIVSEFGLQLYDPQVGERYSS